MPAIDQCHDQIVHALEKAGWEILKSPYVLYIAERRRIYVDLYAQHGQKNGNQTIIIVEVKCFVDERSELNDLYNAIGQYIVYRNWLKMVNSSDKLYLAVPKQAYETVIKPLAMEIITENHIKMIVVNIETEEVEQWLV